MMAVHIEAQGPHGSSLHACYMGDLFPTSHHLDPTWVMGFDLDPITCIAERKRLLSRAIPSSGLSCSPTTTRSLPLPLALNPKGRPSARPLFPHLLA